MAAPNVSIQYPDSMARAATRAVAVRAINSRNRVDPLTTTPSEYTVNLSAVPRVGAVQVGDAVLPTEARSAIDASRRHIGVTAPLVMPSVTQLTVSETDTTYSRTDGSVVAGPTTRSVTVTFPATWNAISAVGSSVTTAAAHGLDTVRKYWPASGSGSGGSRDVAPSAFLAGTRCANFDPPLSTATLDASNPTPSATTFTLTSAAVAAMTAASVGGALTLSEMLINSTTNGTAWVYVTPLTVAEAATVITAALKGAGTLKREYTVAQDTATGEVLVSANSGDVLTDTRRRSFTTTFAVTAGDLLWRLGLPPGTVPIRTYASENLSYDGSRVNPAKYILRVVPRDLRTLELPRGTYTAADLATTLTTVSNSLSVPLTATEAQRTLTFEDSGGTVCTVELPCGRVTVDDAVSYLSAAMTAATGGTLTVAVTYAESSGKFTFGGDLPWALDFSGVDAGLLAGLLGFPPVRLVGGVSYTSATRAVSGRNSAEAESDGSDVTWETRRNLLWTVDDAVSALRVTAADVAATWYLTSTDASDSVITYTASTAATSGVELDPHTQPRDLVRLALTDASSDTAVFTAMALPRASEPTTLADLTTFQVDVGALDGTDLTAADWDGTASLGARGTLLLHAGPLPSGTPLPREDATGAAVTRSTTTSVGTADAYGPVYEQVGLTPTVVAVPDGVLLAPSAYKLSPPDVVYLVLRYPSSQTQRQTFRPLGSSSDVAVLAKFIVTDGFARITEAVDFAPLTSVVAVDRVELQWLNPDGSLVDWAGREHSLSLLFRAWEGHVTGAAVDGSRAHASGGSMASHSASLSAARGSYRVRYSLWSRRALLKSWQRPKSCHFVFSPVAAYSLAAVSSVIVADRPCVRRRAWSCCLFSLLLEWLGCDFQYCVWRLPPWPCVRAIGHLGCLYPAADAPWPHVEIVPHTPCPCPCYCLCCVYPCRSITCT